MELTAENVTSVLTALGLEDKVEDVELDSVVARAEELAARPEEAAETDTRSLADRAKDEGKTLVDADELTSMKSDATAGREAKAELHQAKFDTAYDAAIDGLRCDTSEETKARLQKFYDADDEACIEFLEKSPKLASETARGSGKGAGEPVPDGVDRERHELDKKAKAYAKEHKVSYTEAVHTIVDEEGDE